MVGHPSTSSKEREVMLVHPLTISKGREIMHGNLSTSSKGREGKFSSSPQQGITIWKLTSHRGHNCSSTTLHIQIIWFCMSSCLPPGSTATCTQPPDCCAYGQTCCHLLSSSQLAIFQRQKANFHFTEKIQIYLSNTNANTNIGRIPNYSTEFNCRIQFS